MSEAPPPVSIGEINPNGGNNAIYCYLYLNGVKTAFKCGIYQYYDSPQKKNKYGMIFYTGAAPNIPGLLTLDLESNNLYWQVENSIIKKDQCTVGESLSAAQSTSAIVLVQSINPNLPSQ